MMATSLPYATAPAVPHPAARPGFTVEVALENLASSHEPGMTAPTPFQHTVWLDAWNRALGRRPGLEPLVVTVKDASTGALALRLPLVRRREGVARVVEFADLGLTDYNAPLLGPAAPRNAAAAAALWRAVRRALPADVVRLRKMPAGSTSAGNPLALLRSAAPCPVNGNIVHTGDDFDAWRHSLVRVVRKELERSWRVFERHPGAAFRRITDRAEAHRVIDAMEIQQEARMRAVGADYTLDDPACRAFYRDLVDHGLSSGYVVLTALTVGDEIVASLLGIRDADTYVMIRIGNAGERWSNCSPGRLIIERTMHALHAEGHRAFDFSVGNYDYKRRFGVAAIPLVDVIEALTWRGSAIAVRAAGARWLRRHPHWDARARTLLRRLAGSRGRD